MEKIILDLLAEKKYHEIKEILKKETPQDLAILLDGADDDKVAVIFRILPKEIAAETFVEMDSDTQELLIKSFSDAELKQIFDELYLDDTVTIIEEMPANVVQRILRTSDLDTRRHINEILAYPEDSAGSIMTVEYVNLKPDMTVEESIKRIRRVGVDKETIYTCYVTDPNRVLLGLVTVKTLLMSSDGDMIRDIMDDHVIYVNTTDDKELVANEMSKYDFIAIPVVDHEKRLVGIITFDDAIDVLLEETTEDIEKMAAMTPSDKAYLKTGIFETWRKRIPWLLILMISATFTGKIITSFESALSQVLILNAFIPMLMDTGGNAGGQASVTIIRSLSLGEVRMGDIVRIVWKEFRVSILCGLTLAVVGFFKLITIDGASPTIALVVAITLFLTVVMAKIIGCSLPILAKRLGFDPALMASPIITTIVDALSLLVYFSIAKILLNL